MDPNTLLQHLREWAMSALENNDPEVDAANAFLDLDEWLSKGGFVPKAWETHRESVKGEEF